MNGSKYDHIDISLNVSNNIPKRERNTEHRTSHMPFKSFAVNDKDESGNQDDQFHEADFCFNTNEK